MMFDFGPQPSQELMEDLPDGISADAALAAWRAGYREARHGQDYRLFVDLPDVQPFYKDGYDRGVSDQAVEDSLRTEPNPDDLDAPAPSSHLPIPATLKKPFKYLYEYHAEGQSAAYWMAAVYLLILTADRLVNGRR